MSAIADSTTGCAHGSQCCAPHRGPHSAPKPPTGGTASRPKRRSRSTWSHLRDATDAPVDGVRIWHRTVAPPDLTEVDDLRVTEKALTVLDAAVDGGSRLLDSALLRKYTTVADVVDAQTRNSGRRGSRRSREMVAAIADGSRSERGLEL